MAIRIAFFDAKSYDRENFAKVNENFGFLRGLTPCASSSMQSATLVSLNAWQTMA